MTTDTQRDLSLDQARDAITLQTHLAVSDLAFSEADRQVLRRLAGEVASLAARPIEDEKRALWRRHNALERTRPVIFCDPENGWNEIIARRALGPNRS
jgi:hypothetical protein